MSTVIGLCPKERDPVQVVSGLKEAGFSSESIRILSGVSDFRDLLGDEPSALIVRSAAVGASIGALIYGFAALSAGWCDCNLFHFERTTALVVLLVGFFFGGLIGSVMGFLYGISEYEQETHLYSRALERGDQVVVVETDSNHLEDAMQTLETHGSLGVKTLTDQ